MGDCGGGTGGVREGGAFRRKRGEGRKVWERGGEGRGTKEEEEELVSKGRRAGKRGK